MSNEPIRSYQNLGTSTLAIFIVSRLKAFILFAIIFGAFIWARTYIPEQYGNIAEIATFVGSLIGIFLVIGAFFAGWLEYLHYSIALDMNGLKVKRGFLLQRERSVPYRRIQEVKINRSVSDQIWGVSTVVIDLLGEDDGRPIGEDRLTLEAVGKNLASEIRDELLRRAQVEQITVHQKAQGI